MAVFLDTGFVLALKNKDDTKHTTAKSWMIRFLTGEFGSVYTSVLVFGELVTLARIRLKRADLAMSAGEYLLKSPRIVFLPFVDVDFQPAWKLFQKLREKRLSFTDCGILAQCERLHCSMLATFDDHFKGLIPTIEDRVTG